MRDPGTRYSDAVRYCAFRRRAYYVGGILFAAVVAVGAWVDIPLAYAPCLFFSIMFFMSSLYYDNSIKLLLVMDHVDEIAGRSAPSGPEAPGRAS